MIRGGIVFAAGILVGMWLDGHAFAQGDGIFPGPGGRPCAPNPNAMEAFLLKQYHEVPIGAGNEGKAVAQMFTSKAGTWTLTATTPDGVTCLMFAGENWDRFNTELPDPSQRSS